MITLRLLAHWTLAVCWIVLVAFFVANWFRVRAYRRKFGEVWEGRMEDRPSRTGLYLQGGLVLAFIPAGGPRPGWLLLAAAVLAVASTLLVRWAFHHLGAHWRVTTVVTADHQLITTGPYRFVRHPVYTALLGIQVATAAMITSPIWAIISLLIYAFGTEIRVEAEDALLFQKFGERHARWKAATRAWIPLLR